MYNTVHIHYFISDFILLKGRDRRVMMQTHTVEIVHFEPIWILGFIPDWNLDEFTILIPDFGRCLFDYFINDLWIFLR
jgi:hypothetical protein